MIKWGWQAETIKRRRENKEKMREQREKETRDQPPGNTASHEERSNESYTKIKKDKSTEAKIVRIT